MKEIALTTYEWLYGTAVVAVVFLSIVAGLLALSLFKAAFKHDQLKAWRILIWTLVLFALVEIFGALKIFGIYSTPYLTHVTSNFAILTLVAALVVQVYVNKGCA